MIVPAEIWLAATEDDGRLVGISSGYRPSFWFGDVVDGRRVMSDASLHFASALLLPGEKTSGTLRPYEPARWANLRPGTEVDFFEGPRKTGTIRILSVEVDQERRDP